MHQALEDTGSQDVHDRALLYYRLLAHDVQSTAAVFKVIIAFFFITFNFSDDLTFIAHTHNFGDHPAT